MRQTHYWKYDIGIKSALGLKAFLQTTLQVSFSGAEIDITDRRQIPQYERIENRRN